MTRVTPDGIDERLARCRGAADRVGGLGLCGGILSVRSVLGVSVDEP